jgi:sugar O-acyltransferase (sialic acid O-acetyltransferase NeuD family)
MTSPELALPPAGAPLRVAIIGAGALGQQIGQHLQQAGWAVAGFFDDFAPPGTATANGPVLGRVGEAPIQHAAGNFDALLMGIGYKHLAMRQQLFDALATQVPFATFIHPAAYVDNSAAIAPGCFVSPGCVLDLNVRLGPNTFLYPGCVLAHDTAVVGHAFLAPAVRLAGHVVVGERCFLGIGTTVIDGLRLGSDIRTGGGATVVANLTEPGAYIGTPARKMPSRP